MIENILVLGLALSLDAFGVALGIGCVKRLKMKERIWLILSFGFFQYLFVFLGGIIGNYINKNIFNISGYLSGAVIFILGILLLIEGFKNEKDSLDYDLNFWKYLLLGISVSIDALGVGFSLLYKYSIYKLFLNSLVVGIITFVLTTISLILVQYIRNFKIVERYSAYIGGVILIIFGLNMFF